MLENFPEHARVQTVVETVDCLIDARWVVPVEPEGLVLSDHSVAVRDGTIIAVLPTQEAATRFSPREHVQLPAHALIPGLINLHGHAAMTLMRGLADDLPLMQWLEKHIWPAEARHVSRDFVYDGSLLACSEMLLGGITTFNDMYFFPEATARAAIDSGMRAAIGIIALEFPTAYAADADDYMQKGLAARDAFKNEPRLSFCMAPHAPYTVSDLTFERMLIMAEELDLPIHTHLHETRDEIEGSMKTHGKRPLARLHAMGLVGPRLIGVHSVHMDNAEIELLARSGASVAHCATSNLKLANGLPPIARMLECGVNIGLGTDGAASNNRLDMFQEMRLAALLAKGASGKADALPAAKALTAATLGGARALGLESRLGSLLPGKAADLCAVNFAQVGLQPCYDPVSHLVYAAGREHVTHVWVEGVCLVRKGGLVTLNEHNLYSRIHLWQNKLVLET
jgi:5-methylthioadenosine/S-adenosylhomocysteine deaminase